MVKRLTLSCLMAAAALALWMGTGCGPSTELTGAPIPNLPPSTNVTGYPPSSIETGFIVHFHWSGFDPDGRVVKYQWRISDNGTNGISVRDTLTFDPVTGDTLNPWHETTATDSVFMVTADLPNFPGDPTGGSYPRSFQTHTFWVRAVDDRGAVDPTPAHVSFTSTTLVPTVRLDGPSTVFGQQTLAVNVVPTPTFSFRGEDPDFVTGMPTQYRYMWIEAVHQDNPIRRKTEYDQHIDDLIDFADTNWTAWLRYPFDADKRRIRIEDEGAVAGDDRYWFLAIQVQDTAGAVSIARDYGRQVANVRIVDNQRPMLRVFERFLGRWSAVGIPPSVYADVAQGQEVQFSWFADVGHYLGRIESFRWGWNVSDYTDPDDPNWAVQPGLSDDHRMTPRDVSFAAGTHVLTVKVVDNSNQYSLFRATLTVVRVPAREDQRPTLFVDDVLDFGTNAWRSNPAHPPVVPLGSSTYRDAFWFNILGGVSGFDPGQDVFETQSPTVPLTYRRAVEYKTLIWISEDRHGGGYAATQFRPSFHSQTGDVDKFIWLAPYMRNAGNVLYAGNMAMFNHLGTARYEMPVIFESQGGDPVTGLTPSEYRRGFGRRDDGGGTSYWVGETRFPFASMGISVLDIMTHDFYVQYDQATTLVANRTPRCVAMKGVTIDPEFKARYMPAGGVFPDRILTEPRIDWRDQGLAPSILTRPIEAWQWTNDEFYNENTIGRPDRYTVQEGAAWGCDGLCVYPMFRSISRFNWIRAMYRAADPDSDWPDGYFSPAQIRNLCGPNALVNDADGVSRSVLTHDRTVGFIAQKAIHDKPYPVGDVVFGFDPYRFNNEHMTRVIRWVLGSHFDLPMTADDDKYHR